jgi:hypothetical protein
MTCLVMNPVPTPIKLESWGQLHFVLIRSGMLSTKFYHSGLTNMVLAAKISDKPSLHLPAAQSQFYKNQKICHNQAKKRGY